MVHVYSAEWIWCTRWHGTSPTTPIAPDTLPDLPSLMGAWQEIEAKIRAFVNGLDDQSITRAMDYRLLNGQPGRSLIWHMPAFYQRPKTIDDLASFLAGKILNALGFDQQLFPPWKGEGRSAGTKPPGSHSE